MLIIINVLLLQLSTIPTSALFPSATPSLVQPMLPDILNHIQNPFHITVLLSHTSWGGDITIPLCPQYSIQACALPYHYCSPVNTIQCTNLRSPIPLVFPVNNIQCTNQPSPIPLLFSCEWNTAYKPVLTHTIFVFLWTKHSVQTCAHPYHYCFPVNEIQCTNLCSPILSLFSFERNTAYKPALTHPIIVFQWTSYSIKVCTHPYMRNRATTAGRLSADT